MERSKALGVVMASVLLGGGVIVLAGFALASVTPHQAALNCVKSTTQANTCNLNFNTFPDSLEGVHGAGGGPHPDWVTYSNDNFVVPANTTVNVTIDQYDGGGALNNAFFDRVQGTIGGTATYNGKTESQVDPNAIGHTFTLRGIPGNGKTLFVSVPLPLNPSAKTPVKIGDGVYPKPLVVQFSFKTGGKAVYEWNCEFPCGGSRVGQGFGYAMSSWGYMSGTLTVN